MTASGAESIGNGSDIEWLLDTHKELRTSCIDATTMERILATFMQRAPASLGAILIPDRAIEAVRVVPSAVDGILEAYRTLAADLMAKVETRAVLVTAGRRTGGIPCEAIAVSVPKRRTGVSGWVLVLDASGNPEMTRRTVLLMRHLAQQIGAILDEKYDALTRLLARGAFEQMVVRIVESDETRPFAIVYLDIDSMHMVNESLGFDAGDEVIESVAGLLGPPVLPAAALACRVAGDGFAVLLPDHDLMDAQRRVELLQREAARICVGPPQRPIAISISCGVAPIAPKAMPLPQALAAAELACRTAKEHGRGRSEVFLDIDDSMMRRQQDMVRAVRLRCALDNDLFEIYGQRIISLADPAESYGAECLLRLMSECGKPEAPGEFLSAAQRYRMMSTIDEWVLRHVLEVVRPRMAWLLQERLRLTVNLSGQSLSDAVCLQRLENILRDSSVAPGLITFEITETAAISNLDRIQHFMRNLKRIGCRFALDDFGTGVNSLSALKTLPVDVVKIDGAFVRDLPTSAGSQAMVRAILEIAKAYQFECVAEYVESEAIIRKLLSLGVGYAQGYAIHRPEPLATLLGALETEIAERKGIELAGY